jgi:hypothetical protein
MSEEKPKRIPKEEIIFTCIDCNKQFLINSTYRFLPRCKKCHAIAFPNDDRVYADWMKKPDGKFIQAP